MNAFEGILKDKGDKEEDSANRDAEGLDSEYEDVYISRVDEYSKKKVPGSGIMFAKAHKDGKYYWLNKRVEIDRDQVNSKEVGEIVYKKWCELLD